MLDHEEDAVELRGQGFSETFGMRDWTHERELLSALVDEVRLMHRTLYSANGGKDSFQFKPTPRPVTALDRIERRERLARHAERVRIMLPNG